MQINNKLVKIVCYGITTNSYENLTAYETSYLPKCLGPHSSVTYNTLLLWSHLEDVDLDNVRFCKIVLLVKQVTKSKDCNN